MRFELIDTILELVPGHRIVAVKAVTRAEEYLDDHFPTFPVLPGVLMLEALAEAGAWLVRDAQDFAASVILLREARNVTYKSFVRPGRVMRLEVTCRRLAEHESEFSGMGYCDRVEVVRARFGLTHVCLATRDASLASIDASLTASARARLAQLLAQDADAGKTPSQPSSAGVRG